MAATTPNMGLKVWNLLTDSYDHAQLAENFAKIDQHQHTEGQGAQIPTGGIENGAISGSKIGNEQVSPEKLTTVAAESVGMNTPSRTYRKVVTNEETYKNETTSYTVVDSATVYVPLNARLMISYMSVQKATTASATAQLFIDSVEVKKVAAGGGPSALSVATLEASSFFGILQTGSSGLEVIKGATANSFYVSTGLVSSGITIFGLPAGTHTVEVKAKAGTSGTIEIASRRLWARSEPYV